MELPQDAQDKIKQLQNYEQKVQALGLQRHKVEGELTEIESALSALEDKKTKDVYKIVANVMVSAEKEPLIKDLATQKKKIEIRISSLEKQENELRTVAEAMQAEVLKKMKDK